MEAVWGLLRYLTDTLIAFCPYQFLPAAVSQPVLDVGGARYRVLKQLGEGGYAFVYLAQQLGETGSYCAIKKILAANAEKLAEAKHEIEVLQALSHVNCLPLLAHAINPSTSAAAGRGYNVLLVFPAYQDGTLLEELDRLAVEGRRLSSRQVLEIFRQICAGVGHMHSRGYAHRDIKPHNVLIKRPGCRQQQQQRHQRQQQQAPSVPRLGSRPRIRAAAVPDSDDDAEGDLEAGTSLVSSAQQGYQAVVMDFGSARQFPVHVSTRAQALAAQEDAEAHCTATFRAPELIDVPSHCTLTSAVDVWALGCTLYAMMYGGGASPFQRALDQGSSLALAVLNCHIPWPSSSHKHYPEAMHRLVERCLQIEPARRPTVPQLIAEVDNALQGLAER